MVLLSVDGTIGIASIGFSVSCVVFGILSTQVFAYFQRYPADKVPYKLLVIVVWIIELLEEICIGFVVYHYSITHYNDPFILFTEPLPLPAILQIAGAASTATIVKCCFAMRIWRFSKKNLYITGLIYMMIAAQFGFAITYCVRASKIENLTYMHELYPFATLALGSGLTTDVVIAIALCYFLRQLRTGFRKSDHLVNTLSIYAINTGVLTGAISLLTLILYDTNSDAFYFMAPYFSLGKLYAISFLCTLNSRKISTGRGTDRQGISNSKSNSRHALVTASNKRHTRDHEYRSQGEVLKIGVFQEVSVTLDEHTDHNTFVVPPYSKNDLNV